MENTTPEAAGFALKLLAVMDEVKSIDKNGTNEHFKYKFASESDVLREVRAAMVKHKLALIPSALGTTKEGKSTRVQVEFCLMDAETGFSRSSVWWGESDDAQDKGTSKAFTSCVKYFLLKLFLIPTGEDPDADGPQQQTKGKPQPKAQLPAPTVPEAITYLDVIGKWGIAPSEWAEFGRFCKDKGLKATDELVKGFEAGCRDLQDVSTRLPQVTVI